MQQDKVTPEVFSEWMEKNLDCLGVSRWLLLPNRSLSLVNKLDTLTFYQVQIQANSLLGQKKYSQ